MNKILVFMGILVVFCLFTGAVSAADWTVNPGDIIQAVVNSAGENHTDLPSGELCTAILM